MEVGDRSVLVSEKRDIKSLKDHYYKGGEEWLKTNLGE